LGDVKGWVSKKDADLWTSLFLMVLSGSAIREAIDLEVGNPNNPGSGFMIFGASAVLGLLALHRFIKSLGSSKQKQGAAAEGIHWGRIVSVVVANALYILFLQTLGYLVCTFLFLSFCFQVLERGRWTTRIIGAALTAFLTHFFFARLLQLNLPKGVLPLF